MYNTNGENILTPGLGAPKRRGMEWYFIKANEYIYIYIGMKMVLIARFQDN